MDKAAQIRPITAAHVSNRDCGEPIRKIHVCVSDINQPTRCCHARPAAAVRRMANCGLRLLVRPVLCWIQACRVCVFSINLTRGFFYLSWHTVSFFVLLRPFFSDNNMATENSAIIDKFKRMVGGRVQPYETVCTQRTPVLTKIADTPKLVCQYTGLLCDDVYCASNGKSQSGWVADPQLAAEILRLQTGLQPSVPVMKKNALQIADAEKKKIANSKKKDKCFFKIDGTNVEKMQALNDMDAIRKVLAEGHGWFNLQIACGDLSFDCFVVSVKPLDPKKLVECLMYDGKYEGKAPKLPKLPIALITCTEKVAASIPRLKMLLKEHAGKMPLAPKRIKKIQQDIKAEQEQEKFNHKHNNPKLRNVDRVAWKTPKRLRDVANGTEPPVKPKRARKRKTAEEARIDKALDDIREPCGFEEEPECPVEGCDSL